MGRNLADGQATPVSKAYRKTHPGLRPKAIPVMGGTNSDPYNWKGIAAQLAAQKKKPSSSSKSSNKSSSNTKQSAQKRIVAAAAPRAASVASAPAAPVKSAKQLLDEFRAANGGALPPGMTPETAALIDAGIDVTAMQGANPAQANALLLIQQQLMGLPGAYDASRGKISADYAKLTGDVETAGADWMKALYGNVFDPAAVAADPNAALAQADPAFANYANDLGQIEETGDINEATDLAWFTKNQQAQQAYLESLRTGVAGGTIPIGGTVSGGGGGGGGGGGRGGRGYGGRGYGGRGYGGGGGGDGEWSDPKTTSTRTETQTDTGTQTIADYNVEFFENLLAETANDPELRELAIRQFGLSNQTPQGMTTQLSKGMTEAEAIEMEYALQEEKRGQWEEARPINKDLAVEKWRNNVGLVRGDDPRTDQQEMWHIPASNATRQINNTDEQRIENQRGEQLRSAGDTGIGRLVAAMRGEDKTGLGTATSLWNWGKNKKIPMSKMTPNQEQLLEQFGSEDLDKAQSAASSERPFSYKDWSGYVDPVDEEERAKNEKLIAYYQILLDTALRGNPNVQPQITKETQVLSQQDKDQLQSKQTMYNDPNPVGGNLNDMYPNGRGLDTTPLFGGAGSPSYEYDTDPATAPVYGTDDTYVDPAAGLSFIGGGGTSSPIVAIPEKARVQAEKQQSLAELARGRMSRDRSAIGSITNGGILGGFGKSKAKPIAKAKPPSKVEAANKEPKRKAASTSGAGNARTRQLADGRRTPASKASKAPAARVITPNRPPSGFAKGAFFNPKLVKKNGKTKAQVAASKAKPKYKPTSRRPTYNR